ncbi:hypothetical protein CK203_046823 [Vitis vinifera]|uniref:Uncharacterized protein n=1 Tax=Vitis vinifera TaxID=29760 RepID=A0A438HYB3_VITVI|nr:hypothetical protein CK203_046823 [Vitis vinifera]
MARDKRKVVIQSDNEARHSPRQNCVRPLMQSEVRLGRRPVLIAQPPKTTKPITTPPHPRTAPPTTSSTCPPSLGVCVDAPGVDLSRRELGQEFSYDIQAFSTYEPTAQSMRGYQELHFSVRGRDDIISSDTIATAFGLPSSAPSEARFAPQSRPAFPRIARILAPQGTRCRSAITRLKMPQILWRVVESCSTHHGYHHLFFSEGEGEIVSFSSKLSHSFASVALILLAPSWSPVTQTKERFARCSTPIYYREPAPVCAYFDTSLPVLPISLPPPLSGAPEPAVPISTPAVPVFDLPRPSQPQVADATSSTLSIMARLDTLQELFVSMDSRIDARLSKMETRMDDLTFSVQQLTSLVIPSRQRGDFVTPADTSLEVDGGTKVISSGSNTRAPTVTHETMPILQTSGATGQVDGEIFIRATATGMDIIIWDDPPMVRDLSEAITPIVEITGQATTPMLEEIAGVVTPIIGA